MIITVILSLFSFQIVFLCVSSWLSWNLLCRLGWPRTQRSLSASRCPTTTTPHLLSPYPSHQASLQFTHRIFIPWPALLPWAWMPWAKGRSVWLKRCVHQRREWSVNTWTEVWKWPWEEGKRTWEFPQRRINAKEEWFASQVALEGGVR